MLFLMVLLAPLTAFCGTIVQVDTIDTVKKALETATVDDLIVFDVDNTLLVPHDKLLRPCGEEFIMKKFEQLGKTATDERINLLVSRVLLTRTFRSVDAHMPAYVRGLQGRSIKVIALTAFKTGRLGAMPSVEEWRQRELLSLGYDFSSAFPGYNHIVFGDIMKEGTLPIYKDGILYSGKLPKGEILQAFLRRVKWQPKRVFFIDDKREYIDSVHQSMTSWGVDCHCFHYCNAEMAADVLDEELAERQFHHLHTHEQWIHEADLTPISR